METCREVYQNVHTKRVVVVVPDGYRATSRPTVSIIDSYLYTWPVRESLEAAIIDATEVSWMN